MVLFSDRRVVSRRVHALLASSISRLQGLEQASASGFNAAQI